jgi:zinc/manganese transport system permease protein
VSLAGLDASILLPAFAAGLIVAATHVPLGMQVLARGIVFIDLAVAQVAGVGVILAHSLADDPGALAVQGAALATALAGALLLTWTEKRWPEVQEATIGTVFVLAASAGILLLAGNPHGAEHLKDLLVGQILWVTPSQLAVPAALTAAILGAWLALGEKLKRVGFYCLFALSVTISVQLVGIYLVFASLIVPALATRNFGRLRLAAAYAVGAAGYAAGLILSAPLDLPSGAVVVWTLALLGVACYAAGPAKRPV